MRAAILVVLLAVAAAACGPGGPSAGATAGATTLEPGAGVLQGRLRAIDAAVSRWRAATELPAARRAAEEARNLVVGPDGPFYGDADGDGTVAGDSVIGLLPGRAGEVGLATTDAGACIERDVLGGSWSDPGARWSILEAAIAAWTPSNNTFPSLPSHPQRIVGWATLTLDAADLAKAVEYGGHAQLHIDISSRAVSDCPG